MRAVEWNPAGPAVRVVDQRRLPASVEHRDLLSVQEVALGIADMTVRGAPTIGAVAAFGLALAAHASNASTLPLLWDDITRARLILQSSRPTAVNLVWALDRVTRRVIESRPTSVAAAKAALLTEAQRLADDEVARNQRIGRHGAALLADGDTVIHHCHTGGLAAVDYGTALGIIRTAHEQGKRVHVLVDETRPRLQGARLTAWELQQLGIAHEIITDSAAGHFLQRGEVQAVLVGADRVAANGDVANKVGTYMLALAAAANHVPFYSAFPTSTVDPECADGASVPIEERPADEVLHLSIDGQPIAPAGSRARNPAFDVTPHELITALVTEAGVHRPPFGPALLQATIEGRPA
jgi:methylthioribose-1-phosphate isomerase